MSTTTPCPTCSEENPPGASICLSCFGPLAGPSSARNTPPAGPAAADTDPAQGWQCACGRWNAGADVLCADDGSPRPARAPGRLPQRSVTPRADRSAIMVTLPNGARLDLVDGDTLKLGRHSPNAAVREALENYDGVSRMHASVTVSGGVVTVTDHSTNGTRVNGQSVDASLKIAADEVTTIQLGRYAVLHAQPVGSVAI